MVEGLRLAATWEGVWWKVQPPRASCNLGGWVVEGLRLAATT